MHRRCRWLSTAICIHAKVLCITECRCRACEISIACSTKYLLQLILLTPTHCHTLFKLLQTFWFSIMHSINLWRQTWTIRSFNFCWHRQSRLQSRMLHFTSYRTILLLYCIYFSVHLRLTEILLIILHK